MVKLSDSELEVMNVIWKNEVVTSNQIIESLKDRQWNVNTIRTFIQRLLKKNAIIVYDKKGKQNFYKSNLDKEAYIQEITNIYVKKYKMLKSEN